MELTVEELYLIAWYRALGAYYRVALHGWLMTGDHRLILGLWGRIIDSEAYQLFEVAAPEGR